MNRSTADGAEGADDGGGPGFLRRNDDLSIRNLVLGSQPFRRESSVPLLRRRGAKLDHQSIEADIGERVGAEVDVSEVVMRGGLVRHGDGPELGAFRGEGAGVGIFERDRFGSAESKAVKDEMIKVGFRFRGRRVLATGEKLEVLEESETLQMRFDPGMLRVGGEADMDARGASGGKQGFYSRENGLAVQDLVLVGAALEFERGAVGMRAEAVPRVEGVFGVSHAAHESRAIEVHAVAGVHFPVGINERSFGIDDQTVEVKDEGANHGVRKNLAIRENLRRARGLACEIPERSEGAGAR